MNTMISVNQNNFKTAKQSHTVIIFTTPTCPYCHMAKAYLREKHIPFTEINVAGDHAKAREMIQKSGEMGVPQLWIDDEVIIGFDKPHIDAILGI